MWDRAVSTNILYCIYYMNERLHLHVIEDYVIIFHVMAERINPLLKMLDLFWPCIGYQLVRITLVESHWLQFAVPQFPLVSLWLLA